MGGEVEEGREMERPGVCTSEFVLAAAHLRGERFE
jgi:hypothetical protein